MAGLSAPRQRRLFAPMGEKTISPGIFSSANDMHRALSVTFVSEFQYCPAQGPLRLCLLKPYSPYGPMSRKRIPKRFRHPCALKEPCLNRLTPAITRLHTPDCSSTPLPRITNHTCSPQRPVKARRGDCCFPARCLCPDFARHPHASATTCQRRRQGIMHAQRPQ